MHCSARSPSIKTREVARYSESVGGPLRPHEITFDKRGELLVKECALVWACVVSVTEIRNMVPGVTHCINEVIRSGV